MRSPYFALQDIRFEGVIIQAPGAHETANVREGANLLTVNLQEISQKIIADPWVKDVRIERIFPHQLCIKIIERVRPPW